MRGPRTSAFISDTKHQGADAVELKALVDCPTQSGERMSGVNTAFEVSVVQHSGCLEEDLRANQFGYLEFVLSLNARYKCPRTGRLGRERDRREIGSEAVGKIETPPDLRLAGTKVRVSRDFTIN